MEPTIHTVSVVAVPWRFHEFSSQPICLCQHLRIPTLTAMSMASDTRPLMNHWVLPAGAWVIQSRRRPPSLTTEARPALGTLIRHGLQTVKFLFPRRRLRIFFWISHRNLAFSETRCEIWCVNLLALLLGIEEAPHHCHTCHAIARRVYLCLFLVIDVAECSHMDSAVRLCHAIAR